MAHLHDTDDLVSDMEDDQSVTGDHRNIEEVISPGQGDLTVHGLKITTDEDKSDPSPTLIESIAGGPTSTTGDAADSTSVRSLPTVHVTEPQSPLPRPSTARSPDSHPTLSSGIPSSPTRSHRSQWPMAEPSLPLTERRMRHRSAVESRAPGRLSGFFTHLIHRHVPAQPSTSREIANGDRGNTTRGSNPPSRSSSPQPPRTVTPPPPLPAPTLQELGLSLSVVTSDLAPSHFSTAPSSGTFLEPHFLLLCHAQGLDVLPLFSPPAPQPYALVRRVSFKSVVVMEQRGVLVAIAGRRDGVRVYALDEVKRAVEWRVDVEVRRERDRTRREASKKVSNNLESNDQQDAAGKKMSQATLLPGTRAKSSRRNSHVVPPVTPPSISRMPSMKRVKTPTATHLPLPPEPAGRPPPYSSGSSEVQTQLRSQSSVISFRQSRSRRASVTEVLSAAPSRRNAEMDSRRERDPDSKSDWAVGESSDDEAINIVAAGSSGSQALDERTSAMHSPSLPSSQSPVRLERQIASPQVSARSPSSSATIRRNRPATLDLTWSNTNNVIPPEPSPTPTLLTLRQALSHLPSPTVAQSTELGNQIGDEDEDEGPPTPPGERISLAQALMESRIPELPPAGSLRPQEAILISSSHPVATGEEDGPRPLLSDAQSLGRRNAVDRSTRRRRRRWSVLGVFSGSAPNQSAASSSAPPSPISASTTVTPAVSTSTIRGRSGSVAIPASSTTALSRSGSRLSSGGNGNGRSQSTAPQPTSPIPGGLALPSSASHSRFIPRIFSNAFHSRRTDEHTPQTLVCKPLDMENAQKFTGTPSAPHAPPPKLEYVKLPGTKSALMIKAVETAKKSFLAILCGENGEKVELFAGTYRTALGLSRTFILPDSPRSLELQLQGDDLVEVFLMFSQNVFGLEPATVRVREVRIGRAERRAARRRAREIRTGESSTVTDYDPMAGDDDTNVNVSIGVSVSGGPSTRDNGDNQQGALIPAFSPEGPVTNAQPSTNGSLANSTALSHAEELVALATAQMGPYTTFQQLSFAPNFPLASIADEYIIPPTYPAFLEYRATHEPEASGPNHVDLSQVQFSPPGLPVPEPTPPSRWFYRDPKGVIHGPWKAALMQAWYKDGLLPPDLPIRREEEMEYVLLKDLRLQCVDPTQPFRSPPPPPSQAQPLAMIHDHNRPLLPPMSLLSQPRHFGPPALFFSSRGGHSTTIVDARGRSVLKGRFLWSEDDQDDDAKSSLMGRMGDVKRLEAFDVKDRSVLVAMRQGGLEALDLGDALLKPADESRTALPQFSTPPSNMSRRAPFVWKIGTPVSSSPTSATVLTSRSKGTHLPIPYKKQSVSGSKSPGKAEFNIGDPDSEYHDEVLYLGRKDDEIYLCERNEGAFRILRLCPDLS